MADGDFEAKLRADLPRGHAMQAKSRGRERALFRPLADRARREKVDPATLRSVVMIAATRPASTVEFVRWAEAGLHALMFCAWLLLPCRRV